MKELVSWEEKNCLQNCSLQSTSNLSTRKVKLCYKFIKSISGPFAQPDVIQNAPGLPKTRSGKIMRRVLRKVAVNDREVGDISTLADESIVDQLFSNRP